MSTKSHKSKNSGDISRRNFVKTAASGTAALTVLPSFTVSGLGHVPPSDKLPAAGVAAIRSFCLFPGTKRSVSRRSTRESGVIWMVIGGNG